ncbi:MAG: hypothetical protein Fur006_59150 [Coleofasciculaceae cyanobacterium]
MTMPLDVQSNELHSDRLLEVPLTLMELLAIAVRISRLSSSRLIRDPSSTSGYYEPVHKI